MKDRILRTDTLRHCLNPGKEAALLAFVRDYRRVAIVLGREQWRLFFERGQTSANHPDKALNGFCGAAPVQMARHQAVEQIDGWMSNRQNEFRQAVERSSLPPDIRRMLHIVNRMRAWFKRDDIAMRATGENIPSEVRRLGRSIMRQVMRRHRRPDLSCISPRLDRRITLAIGKAKSACYAHVWATLRLPHRGTIQVPLQSHHRFESRFGSLCPVVQLVTNDAGALGIRLVTDVTTEFARSRESYVARCAIVGIDFGLATLMATDKGDLFGRGWLQDLKRVDKQIVGIARHRMRSGGKPRDSQRYCDLVTRLRGMIRTRVNAVLNRIVQVHAPAELVVERLDFGHPNLSRRMNRLLRNCGRAVFRAKIADLEQQFGITTTEINPAYTSRECSHCGYVDSRNRPSQSRFSCLWCGRTVHADVNGAQVITGRRSSGSGLDRADKGDILRVLVRRHTKRWPEITTRHHGRKGTANDPRLSNRYFAEWAGSARKLQKTEEDVPLVSMQRSPEHVGSDGPTHSARVISTGPEGRCSISPAAWTGTAAPMRSAGELNPGQGIERR